MSVTVCRKARKAHRCDGCGRGGKIQPGDLYLTHTALRGDDTYHDALDRRTLKPANRPQRYAECADCAIRYGRSELLYPILEGQATIDDVIEGGDDAVHEDPVQQ